MNSYAYYARRTVVSYDIFEFLWVVYIEVRKKIDFTLKNNYPRFFVFYFKYILYLELGR